MTQTSDTFRIRSELLNILLAGRDTTASLLSNVFHTLSRRPDIFAALRSEIARILPEASLPPDFAQLKEMKYLRAVLNESLRLYPVVPGNSRQAVADTTLPLGGGKDGKSPVFVPKGTVVNWSVYTMHRRKDFFGSDSEEFRPERWLGEKALRPGWEYLPFNGGARICLGRESFLFFLFFFLLSRDCQLSLPFTLEATSFPFVCFPESLLLPVTCFYSCAPWKLCFFVCLFACLLVCLLACLIA